MKTKYNDEDWDENKFKMNKNATDLENKINLYLWFLGNYLTKTQYQCKYHRVFEVNCYHSYTNVLTVDKPQCKKCAKALQELENIDDEADQLGIGFVKISDEALADEYNLGELPKLVYYRHQIPIIYESMTKPLNVICIIM